MPLITVLVLAGFGTSALQQISRASAEEELFVEVVGYQFSWNFSYPSYGITSPELVLPVNESALFKLKSTDVIQSFWIPEFRIKTDVIPGLINQERVTPTELGEYRALCSELCGTGHAYMTAVVRVVGPAVFRDWVEEQQAAADVPAGGAEQGNQVYRTYCTTCHTVDGSAAIGPSLRDLYGSRRSFEDGTATIADEDYIRASIVTPGQQIVQGYANVMPPGYDEQLRGEQIDALIEFIKGLDLQPTTRSGCSAASGGSLIWLGLQEYLGRTERHIRRVLSTGLVRGLLAGIAGAAAGIALTVAVRAVVGMPAFDAMAAATAGIFSGTIAFLAGVGAFRDWWGWSRGEAAAHPAPPQS